MANSVVHFDVKCPIEGCKVVAVAETTADFATMSAEDKKTVEKTARRNLAKALEKHHADGHPNGPSYAETELGKKQ